MNQRATAIVFAAYSLVCAGASWAANTVTLTTRVSGVVETVRVKSGQQVKKGALLLSLDKTILQARLEEAAAEQARAQAEESEARRELDRAQELYSRTVSSTSELDAAKLREARTQAALATAKARHAIARKNLQDADLRAPFDAVVNAIPGMAGTVVAADCQPPPLIIVTPRP